MLHVDMGAGVLHAMRSYEMTASLPVAVQTACGSIVAGAWRALLMPIDSAKVIMQVHQWRSLCISATVTLAVNPVIFPA